MSAPPPPPLTLFLTPTAFTNRLFAIALIAVVILECLLLAPKVVEKLRKLNTHFWRCMLLVWVLLMTLAIVNMYQLLAVLTEYQGLYANLPLLGVTITNYSSLFLASGLLGSLRVYRSYAVVARDVNKRFLYAFLVVHWCIIIMLTAFTLQQQVEFAYTKTFLSFTGIVLVVGQWYFRLITLFNDAFFVFKIRKVAIVKPPTNKNTTTISSDDGAVKSRFGLAWYEEVFYTVFPTGSTIFWTILAFNSATASFASYVGSSLAFFEFLSFFNYSNRVMEAAFEKDNHKSGKSTNMPTASVARASMPKSGNAGTAV